MSYIQIEDATNKVKGVYKETPEVVTGCTIYEEEYNGSHDWASPDTEVFRDGFEDYRTVDTPKDT